MAIKVRMAINSHQDRNKTLPIDNYKWIREVFSKRKIPNKEEKEQFIKENVFGALNRQIVNSNGKEKILNLNNFDTNMMKLIVKCLFDSNEKFVHPSNLELNEQLRQMFSLNSLNDPNADPKTIDQYRLELIKQINIHWARYENISSKQTLDKSLHANNPELMDSIINHRMMADFRTNAQYWMNKCSLTNGEYEEICQKFLQIHAKK